MQRILSYLAMAGALNMGAIAQVVVLPPQSDIPAHAVIIEPPEMVENAVTVVLSVHGNCKVSNDGRKFRDLRKNAELGEGVTIRTGSSGTADLFLKRMGTTVRLKPNSEITLNRTEQTKDERHELNTIVNVRKGKMLTVVHANVPGSSLDIKNAAGKSLTDTLAGGRYMVSADKIENVSPEQLPAGAAKDFDEKVSNAIKEQIEFDQVQALSETWKDSENPGLEP
jgi:hypothetical protein